MDVDISMDINIKCADMDMDKKFTPVATPASHKSLLKHHFSSKV